MHGFIRDRLGERGVDGRIILKWILKSKIWECWLDWTSSE